MGAMEKIAFAEERVAELQGQLGVVEDILETAGDIVETGQKAGRCLRRTFRVLLIASAVGVVVIVAKKVMDSRSTDVEAEVIIYEPGTEAGAGEAVETGDDEEA